MNFEKISIKEDFIRLDSAMKLADMVVTGGHAKILILEGEVKVNGEVCTARGKKIRPSDTVLVENTEIKVETKN